MFLFVNYHWLRGDLNTQVTAHILANRVPKATGWHIVSKTDRLIQRWLHIFSPISLTIANGSRFSIFSVFPFFPHVRVPKLSQQQKKITNCRWAGTQSGRSRWQCSQRCWRLRRHAGWPQAAKNQNKPITNHDKLRKYDLFEFVNDLLWFFRA